MRQLYTYVANESSRQYYWLRTGWALDSQTCTWLLDSLLCIMCSLEKQWILCSALCHKSYLTLTYVTSLRDSLCLGTFAHAFIRLLPCSCSLVISNQKLVPPLSLCSLVKFYSLIFIFNYGTLKDLTDQSIMIINFMILVTSVPKDVFIC